MQLTKSWFVDGYYCPKLLWYKFNEPSKLPSVSEADLLRMDEGSYAGKKARELFPGGILIEGDWKGSLKRTQELLSEGKPLFEASISSLGGYCKADILVPMPGGWELIEVKSSNSCKKEHIVDVAFQLFVLKEAGIDVRRASVMHLNKEYVRRGEIELEKAYCKEDVTADAIELLPTIPVKVKALLNFMTGMRPPLERLHSCSYPHGACPCSSVDVEELPERNVTELYYGGKKAIELLENEIVLLRDIPESFSLTEKQKVQVRAAKEGVYVNREKISNWLSHLEYPLHHFDFETFSRALPPFDMTRSWQQMPFQFSLHTEESDGSISHSEFLASRGDPRSAVIDALSGISSSGSILVWNASFEKRVLQDLALLDGSVAALCDRLVDLADPFKQFWYYDARQCGSWSLKKVLPCLTDLSYDSLTISRGDEAAVKYLKMCDGQCEVESTRKALLEYCKQDTWAMVKLLEKLRNL